MDHFITRFGFIFVFSLLTSSCATVGSYQSSCEQKYSSFIAVVSCLQQEVRNDPRYNWSADSDLVKLYLAYANQLASQVKKKIITEEDARLKLAEAYTKLKSVSQARKYNQVNSFVPINQASTMYAYSPSVIESYIDGAFEGWNGDTIFKLDNGQIWQQASYAYVYYYAYHPRVLIVNDGYGYKMQVEGLSSTIYVRRLR